MKKISLLLAIFFTGVINVMAFQDADTIVIRSNPDLERITGDLDSLVSSYYVQMALKNDPEIFSNDTVGIQYPDSVYIDRINKINSIVKLRI